MVPVTLLLNTIFVMFAPEQIVCDDGVATATGVGLTVTVAVVVEPVHPYTVGVIVNVTVTGDVVVFVSVPVISPDPLAAIPVTEPVLFLTQLNVVPLIAPDNTMLVIGFPEQVICDDGVATAVTVGQPMTNV